MEKENGMKGKKNEESRKKLTRETQEERKARVSSGIRLRAVVFESQKRKRLEKARKKDAKEEA